MHTQKIPVYTQKSPICSQKNPIYTPAQQKICVDAVREIAVAHYLNAL